MGQRVCHTFVSFAYKDSDFLLSAYCWRRLRIPSVCLLASKMIHHQDIFLDIGHGFGLPCLQMVWNHTLKSNDRLDFKRLFSPPLYVAQASCSNVSAVVGIEKFAKRAELSMLLYTPYLSALVPIRFLLLFCSFNIILFFKQIQSL